MYIPLNHHVQQIIQLFDHGTCHSFIARLSWRPLKGHAPWDPSVPCGSGVSHPVMDINPKGNSDQPSKFGFAYGQYGHMFRQTRINTSVTSVHSRILNGLDEIYTKKWQWKDSLSLSLWYLNQQLSSNASSGILWFERAKPASAPCEVKRLNLGRKRRHEWSTTLCFGLGNRSVDFFSWAISAMETLESFDMVQPQKATKTHAPPRGVRHGHQELRKEPEPTQRSATGNRMDVDVVLTNKAMMATKDVTIL